MDQTREMLEEQVEKCETELGRLNAFVRELEEMAARHGTDESVLEGDLTEARHNITYYESALNHLREELRGGGHVGGRPWPGLGTLLPSTPRQGAGALLLASVSLLAGVLIGSQLASRRGGGAGNR